nr:MAG TPA: Regulatory protein [Caudoviricetes sp.]
MVSDIIKTIMKSKGLNNIKMAQMLGIKPQSFANKLFRDSYTVDELIKILEVLDCKLIIQPNPEIFYTISSEKSSKASL